MILSLDLGTTNLKAAVFDAAAQRVGEASVAAPYTCNDGERVEMDAEAVWQALLELIRSACGSAGCEQSEIESVAVASQAQNVVVVGEDGGARTPIISWLDKRSAPEAAELWQALGEGWHDHCSFNMLSGQMQIAHVLRLRRNMPEAFAGTFKVAPMPAFLFERLCGMNLTDHNLAAMSGLFSLAERDWRQRALDLCGIGAACMPQLVPVGAAVPARPDCSALCFAGTVRLVPAGNDQTAGAFGVGCREGETVVTLGTALVAYRFAGTEPGPFHAQSSWGPYPGGGYYEMSHTEEGCLALDWARELLLPGERVGRFDELAAAGAARLEQDSGFFFPARVRTPGAWSCPGAAPAEKAYAVLEGITFSLRTLAREHLSIGPGASLRAVGGGSKSRFWLQLIADVLECRATRGSGDALLGAALMSLGQTAATRGGDELAPDPRRAELLAARYSRWREQAE